MTEWGGNPEHAYLKRLWNFGGRSEKEPVVLFNWWSDIAEYEGQISYSEDAYSSKQEQSAILADPDVSGPKKGLARKRHGYISERLKLVRTAFLRGSPIRVVLLRGNQAVLQRGGTSTVVHRKLDQESWFVHDFSPVGFFRLVRGRQRPSTLPFFEDQLSDILRDQIKLEDQGGTPSRRGAVRSFVLRRAEGRCEIAGCSHIPFHTHTGAIYLEVHHVVPLSVNGADEFWNAAGICPAHHREAHHGKDRLCILHGLLKVLEAKHPERLEDLARMWNLVPSGNWFEKIDHAALD